jgi:hypothetical protein
LKKISIKEENKEAKKFFIMEKLKRNYNIFKMMTLAAKNIKIQLKKTKKLL